MLIVKQQLEHYLFRSGMHTYAILDGASVPDLPGQLYKMRPPHYCLYRGELPPDIVHFAPYLVQMIQGGEFANWLLSECWGKHWGIFAQSPLSLVGMRKHFRSLLVVNDANGNPLLFRYYDPRAFLTFLPTCNAAELQNFFGKVSHYFVESDDAARLHRFRFMNNELKKTNLVLKPENQI